MYTNHVLIRGNYTYLTVNLYGDSPKFNQKREDDEKVKDSRSESHHHDKKDSSDDEDDLYDDWAFVKNVRDVHKDKIYPITIDSDLPLSDSDEEQEPRMALPLAPPTLPDDIKERAKATDSKDSIKIDPKIKAELESAPPVNERMSDLPLQPPKELKPVHLEQKEPVENKDEQNNQRIDGQNGKSNEPSLARLVAIIKDLKPASQTVRKVTLLEESCECILPWLRQVSPELTTKFITEVAGTLKKHFLSTDLPPAATVRLLKAGLRLVTLIATVSDELTAGLLNQGILQKLLYLINLTHFASSLRIMALHGIDQIISWPKGMASFLRFSNGQDGSLPGSGYEHLVALIIKKPTIRVAFSAGQILAKVDTALSAKQLKCTIFELLKSSPFYESNSEDDISVPKGNNENQRRDSDSEGSKQKSAIVPKKGDFECVFEEIVPYESGVVTNKTIAAIGELLQLLTAVVKDPSSITQISPKELPNRQTKRTGAKGRIFLSRLFEAEDLIKVCLGILHIPYLTAHWPVYSALSDFLIELTNSKEGVLLFAAEYKSSNFIVKTLLASSGPPPAKGDEKRSRNILPVDLAATLAIRLQAIGLLDELLERDESKWTTQHWSPLQGLCALFSHSDSLSTSAADVCAEHSAIVLNIMRDNGPASSQAAEFLHTIIEHCSKVSWLEDIMADINQIMEQDNQISDVLSKLFSGQIQFNIQNSLVTMKRLSEALEFGASIEMIHGPGLSFHTRIFER